MQTEIEKLELISRFLKGQLSGSELDRFEASIKSDPDLYAEIEMQRFANEAIVDHYLVGVKATARRIVDQKAKQTANIRRGMGLGIALLMGGTAFYLINKAEPDPTSPNVKTKTEIILPTKPDENQLNQITTNKSNENEKSVNASVQATKPNYITTVEVTERTNEIQHPQNDPIKIVPSAAPEATKDVQVMGEKPKPAIDKTEETPAVNNQTRNAAEKPEEIQLLLNLSRNEHVTIPIDEAFDGVLNIFNEDGNLVFQQNIRQGYPTTWDGNANSGAQVSSGQYGLTIRNQQGAIVRYGFVTVVR